jgi:HK97 family phage portal protein
MGYLDWLRRPNINRAVKDQNAVWDKEKANKLYDAILNMTANGQALLNEDNLREYVNRGYLYNPDLYAIINLITNSARGIDWVLYEVEDEQKFRKYKRLPSEAKEFQLEKVANLKHGAMTEVHDHSNQLFRLLKKPNELQGWGEFIENLLGFKLITGNAFVHGVILENGVNAGLVNEMWVMPSQYMRIHASGNMEHVIQGYELELSNLKTKFTPDEVMHLKYWNPDYDGDGSHLYGLSPLRSASRVVRQSNDAYTAQSSLLQNSGAMGILSVDADEMTKEQAEQLQYDYQRKYGGPDKRGKIIVAGAKMNWQQIGLSPVDLDIIESQKMSLRDLCNVYNINSALLNDPDNKVYNNVKEARKGLYYEKVIPEMDVLRDELNRWLTARYNEKNGTRYYIDYDLEGIPALQVDLGAVVEQIQNAWWLTGNEKRSAMGYDNDPAMDQYFIPAGLMPTATLDEDELNKDIGGYSVKETFNDYPKSASDLARRALEFKKENPNDCATAVGLKRANDISDRRPLSYETVVRVYSYLSRAKTYDTGSFTDADGNPVCGSISYAYWGGDSMLRWASKTIEEIEGNADAETE